MDKEASQATNGRHLVNAKRRLPATSALMNEVKKSDTAGFFRGKSVSV
jgi:hypothetical protein